MSRSTHNGVYLERSSSCEREVRRVRAGSHRCFGGGIMSGLLKLGCSKRQVTLLRVHLGKVRASRAIACWDSRFRFPNHCYGSGNLARAGLIFILFPFFFFYGDWEELLGGNDHELPRSADSKPESCRPKGKPLHLLGHRGWAFLPFSHEKQKERMPQCMESFALCDIASPAPREPAKPSLARSDARSARGRRGMPMWN